jgi:hypothetical protein
MKKHHKYSLLGIQALRRATVKAVEEAKKNNCQIPYWKNGKIEFDPPVNITERANSSNAKSRAAD